MKYNQKALDDAIDKALLDVGRHIRATMHAREKKLGRAQEWSISHCVENGKLTITVKVICPRSGNAEAIWWTADD